MEPQLDADLLLRVLSNNVTQEDDTTMDPKVLEILSLAIVNAFGEKQVGANTTPPVQAADADPVSSPEFSTDGQVCI